MVSFLREKRFPHIDLLFLFPDSLLELASDVSSGIYGTHDLIVAIDTIEHFHPDEFVETMDTMLVMLNQDGSFYFRNNFQHFDPESHTHFDHTEAYAKWIEDNNLEIYETFEETEAHFIRRKS